MGRLRRVRWPRCFLYGLWLYAGFDSEAAKYGSTPIASNTMALPSRLSALFCSKERAKYLGSIDVGVHPAAPTGTFR